MKQKIRMAIYILIGILIVVIGSIILFNNNANKEKFIGAEEQLNLGNTYLLELSYENAVLTFTEAIEIEPMNADGYIGLAEAYIGLDDVPKAVETLELGYERTGDERLKEMIEELSGVEETTAVTTVATTVEETTTTTEEITTTVEATTTTAETTIATTETTTETVTETVGQLIFDENASYTIDVISAKEAKITITSEIINDDFSLEYNPNIDDDYGRIFLTLQFENIDFGLHIWNLNLEYKQDKTFKWDWDGYSGYSDIYVKYGNYYGYLLYYYYMDQGIDPYNDPLYDYHIYDYLDLENNSIVFDVMLPEAFDFDFNNCGTPELVVYYYE